MAEITATIDDIDRWDAHEILDVIGGEFDDLTWASGGARLIIGGDEGRVRQALNIIMRQYRYSNATIEDR